MLGIIEAADEPAALALAQECWGSNSTAASQLTVQCYNQAGKFISRKGEFCRLPQKCEKRS
jgi:hypothetical protein